MIISFYTLNKLRHWPAIGLSHNLQQIESLLCSALKCVIACSRDVNFKWHSRAGQSFQFFVGNRQ